MASVDGARTLQGASDELYDIICGPCKTDKVEKQANHYCKECKEYLCNPCKDYHRKLAVTKNHTIVSGNRIPAHSSVSQRSDFVAYCGCNKNQEVEFYCEDHQDVICSPCNKIKHRNCKTTNVQEKSAGYTTSTFSSILTETKSLIDKFDSMQIERKTDSKALQCLKEECQNTIKAFRAKIDAFLDTLEQNILGELDKLEDEQLQHIDQHIASFTTASQMLDLEYQQLEDARKDGKKVNMFTSAVQVSKSLQEYEAMLSEMEKGAFKPTISFEGNTRLTDIQTEITTLGTLTRTYMSLDVCAQSEKTCKLNKKLLLGKTIQSNNQVNVKSPDDEHTPIITGCAFMPDGHAVLCDRDNNKIKILDSSLALTESLKLSSFPWDVSVVDDSNVVITLPEKKQVQYIQVFPRLKTGRVIQLDVKCMGIEVFGNEIYTTNPDDSVQTGVLVLELNGDSKRQICVDKFKTGKYNLPKPYYITVSPSGRKIYVSGSSNVTCMTGDGNIIYQYKDKTLEDPCGMYVDAGENIFVCCHLSNNIQVITADGKQYGNLLSSSDVIKHPNSIAYREFDDTLLVGCWQQANTLVLR